MPTKATLKVGTRGSPLALAQTNLVIEKLQAAALKTKFVVVPIKTSGDRIQSATALRKAGKGLFVKEIEKALLARKIDLAVHSLKDVPSELPEGLVIGAYLEREEAADAYISRDGTPIEKLPVHAVLGTASLRRQALLGAFFRHLDFEDLKGNLDTRLDKLMNPRSKLAGIIVAAAGLRRLKGAEAPKHQLLSKTHCVPAAGQGTLALECRAKDEDLLEFLRGVNHEPTQHASEAERAVLRRLEGGCQVPLGVYAESADDGTVKVTAAMAAPDGTKLIRESATGSAGDAEGVAEAIETLLRNRGADDILKALARKGATRAPARRR
jgi:hydroxymethylbilane synthase